MCTNIQHHIKEIIFRNLMLPRKIKVRNLLKRKKNVIKLIQILILDVNDIKTLIFK